MISILCTVVIRLAQSFGVTEYEQGNSLCAQHKIHACTCHCKATLKDQGYTDIDLSVSKGRNANWMAQDSAKAAKQKGAKPSRDMQGFFVSGKK